MEGSSSKHFVTSLLILLLLAINSSYVSSSSMAVLNLQFTDFIKSSCQSTTDPTLFSDSLSSYANWIQTSPQRLAIIAAALLSVSKPSAISVDLSENQRIKDCIESLVNLVGKSTKPEDSASETVVEKTITWAKDATLEKFVKEMKTWGNDVLKAGDKCTDSTGNGGNGLQVTPEAGSVKITVRALNPKRFKIG